MQKRFNPLKPQAQAKSPRPEPLKKGTIPTPLPVGPAPIVTENDEKDGLELRFPQRPGPAVLEFFHSTKDLPAAQRWHFHFKGKYWYAKRNEATRKFAAMLIAHASEDTSRPSPPAPVAASVPVPEPVIVPKNPLELKWEEEMDKGLTALPFDVWVEKYVEAKGDGHPEPIEKAEASNVIPVRFRSLASPWRQRLGGVHCPPVAIGADGKPLLKY